MKNKKNCIAPSTRTLTQSGLLAELLRYQRSKMIELTQRRTVCVDDSVVALEKKPFCDTLESSTESMAMVYKVHTYADLLQQIRNDLRIQHPEWVQPNGESPMCDSYEARLMELLAASKGNGPGDASAVPD